VGYRPLPPTPTIIEAARALYAGHTVEAMSRDDAGARNLGVTSAAVEEIIERSRARHEKAVVFLTGVPGAGKTLVGLNVATRRRDAGEARAVFLSGNGPLVTVLQEVLTRTGTMSVSPRTWRAVWTGTTTDPAGTRSGTGRGRWSSCWSFPRSDRRCASSGI